MVEVGDRVRLSSGKAPDREGIVTAVTGSMLRVRWPSDEETTVVPAPGTLTVLTPSSHQAPSTVRPGRAVPKRPAAKTTTARKTAARKTAAKKGVTKTTTARKTAAKKGAAKTTAANKGAAKNARRGKRPSR
ncbi:MAG: hypothetical protein ACRD0A_09725 [Acidimicrobiales bacterium]